MARALLKTIQNYASTSWTPYTATLTNISASSQSMEWRQVGESIQIRGKIVLSGAVTGNIQIGLPNSLIISNTTTDVTNFIQAYSASGGAFNTGMVSAVDGNNYITILDDSSTATWNATTPSTWGAGDQINIGFAQFKIQGWTDKE